MYKALAALGTPLLIHQPKYSLLVRTPEEGLLDTVEKLGVGCITFSSLAQGLLTDRYLKGIPEDSRAASGRGNGAIDEGVVTEQIVAKVQALNELAQQRSQTLAQMSLAWVLKDKRITSVIIGASKPEQVLDSTQGLRNHNFSEDELRRIDEILG